MSDNPINIKRLKTKEEIRYQERQEKNKEETEKIIGD
jgi:hypothetical protein